jgi:hypothetical protein
VAARNAEVVASRWADPQVSLRKAQKWLKVYKLAGFVQAELDGPTVRLVIDESARTKAEELDGCYVVVTDIPTARAGAQTVWDRYGDLQKVERDFRTMKTVCLELRPIYLRKASRPRAHALITMLSLKLVRELERLILPLGLTVKDALDRLEGVRLITLVDPAFSLWRLPSRWEPEQRRDLDVLPALPPPLLSLHPAVVAG